MRKIISVILRIPLHLFLLASFGASIYAAANKIQGMNWSTPLIFAAILISWYIGIYLKKDNNNKNSIDFASNFWEGKDEPIRK